MVICDLLSNILTRKCNITSSGCLCASNMLVYVSVTEYGLQLRDIETNAQFGVHINSNALVNIKKNKIHIVQPSLDMVLHILS